MRILIAVFVLACCLQEPVSAQYRMDGLALSLRGHAATWKLNDVEDIDFDADGGGGAGAEVQYGMSNFFGIFGRIDLSNVSSSVGDGYTLTHFDVGVRVLPALVSTEIRPYAELAFTARSAEFNIGLTSLEVTGPGATVGVGVLGFVAPRFGVSIGAAGTFGNMEDVILGGLTVDTSVKATSWRLGAGVVWFP